MGERVCTNVALGANGEDGGEVLGVGPALLKLDLGEVLHGVCVGEDAPAADDEAAAAGAVLPLPLPRQREVGLGVHAEDLDHRVHGRHHPPDLLPARGAQLRHCRVHPVRHGLRLPAAGRRRRARGVRFSCGLEASRLAPAAATGGGGGAVGDRGCGGGGCSRGVGGRRAVVRCRLVLAAALALALGGGAVHGGGGLGFLGARVEGPPSRGRRGGEARLACLVRSERIMEDRPVRPRDAYGARRQPLPQVFRFVPGDTSSI